MHLTCRLRGAKELHIGFGISMRLDHLRSSKIVLNYTARAWEPGNEARLQAPQDWESGYTPRMEFIVI